MLARIVKKILGYETDSKNAAKSRLHFVLVQDRAGLTNEEMVSFRRELVDVIEKYFVIDEQGFDIDYEREGDSTTLLINSPVIVKRQEAHKGIAGARHGKAKGKKNKRGRSTGQSATSQATA